MPHCVVPVRPPGGSLGVCRFVIDPWRGRVENLRQRRGRPLPRRLGQRPALARVCEGAELTDEAGARGCPQKESTKVYIVVALRVIPSPSPSLETQWPQRMTKANRSRTHAELVERAWGARDLAKEADDARRGEERTAEVMGSPGGRFRSPRRSDQRLFSRFKRPEKC